MEILPDIPGYHVQYRLGEGGMAKVYFGVQTKLKRRVAIKVMEGFLLKDENFSRRFLKEAETAANLNHPNIVTIYDVGQAGDSYYMVMEYLDGTLKDRIQRARSEGGHGLPSNEAVRVLESVAAALEYAHNQGYIHRDIKPDNIMYRNGETPVLVDFGIAKAIGTTTKLTKTGMSIGTPHYMSPEQIRGLEVDGRADLYSLGVLFFEMLTGEVPYKATDYIAVVMKHLNDPVPSLPPALQRFQPLLNRLMAKDKEHRVQSGRELLKMLRELRSGAAAASPPSGPGEPVVEPTVVSPVPEPAVTSADFRPARRRRTAPLLVILLALTVTALMVIWQPWKNPVPADSGGPQPRSTAVSAVVPEEKADSLPDGGKKQDSPAADHATPKETQAPSTPGGKISGSPQTREGAEPESTRNPGDDSTAPASTGSPEKDAANSEPAGKGGKDQSAPPPGDSGKNPGKTAEITPPATRPREKPAPPAQTATAVPAPQTVRMIRVQTDLVRGYIDRMDRIVVNLLPRGIKVLGTLTLELNIERDGHVRVVKALDTQVKVVPPLRARAVRRLILNRIHSIQLQPPRNKEGQAVRVEDWRLSYSVGTYEGRIILKRRF